ncbi:MAG: hypothetical protein ACC652_01265 [Acidimicrobiales bacterium]
MKAKLALFTMIVLLAAACGDSSQSGDETLGDGPYPVATFDITITYPDANDVDYTISCLGDTASVTGEVDVDGPAACTRLADEDVRVRLVEGPPPDQICTEIYGGPDVAIIVGSHDGDVVDTTVDRTNGCGIDDWDQLLKGILPTALGLPEGSY